MSRLTTKFALLMSATVLANISHATDGVLEINQTCALNGGCFSGDMAGFPVSIDGSAGKSYRLTSSLDLTSHPTDPAISISAAFVTLDLNGFEIAGVATCELAPGGFDWNCEPINPGAHGIELLSEAESATIKNGTIRNMPNDGIEGPDTRMVRIEGITTSRNAGWGVRLGDQSLIAHSRSMRNHSGGFSTQNYANISHSEAHFNGGVGIDAESYATVIASSGVGFVFRGFNLGPNSKYMNNTATWQLNGEPALCGGGVCASKKRFYLTNSVHKGDDVLATCAAGFHMASLFELLDVSNLQYDWIHGSTRPDSGSGPPAELGGWIRTGYAAGGNEEFPNCHNWTSNLGTDDGANVHLAPPNQWNAPADNGSPFSYFAFGCSSEWGVWCVED